ncbi:hypothetical protein [Microbacterium gilvum]|uniref:Single-stranded DNA-binding protein n=1 Tax=Microbacterium gilvum TaxID=1336204 RepID=A0ABP9A605_9MICO
MATIVFKAFIDDVLIGRDGPWALRTSELHQRKTDTGYETVARTFRTVKGDIDFTRYAKGDRVAVAGQERTEKRTHEGKDYYDLVVWAEAVSHVPTRQNLRDGVNAPQTPAQAPQQAPQADTWDTATPGSADVPF